MHFRSRRGASVGWAACALAIALCAIGCGGAGEQESAPAPEVALRVALERLLRGDAKPASEHTWFSTATAGALRTLSVDSTGHAIVDFEDLRALIPNASSSAGSAILLEELNRTVFSVDAVLSVDYLIEGRCELFWEWLQYGCQTVQRPEEQPAAPRPYSSSWRPDTTHHVRHRLTA